MYFKFIAISIIGMLIQLGFNYMFVNNMHMYYLVAAFISIVIASGVNFVLNRKITFGIRL
jgi:putative flippase GtrA